jgi:hypothetical protein
MDTVELEVGRRFGREGFAKLPCATVAAALAHLGPGLGDVGASTLQHRVRGRGLLLRPAKPPAAGLEREHERGA